MKYLRTFKWAKHCWNCGKLIIPGEYCLRELIHNRYGAEVVYFCTNCILSGEDFEEGYPGIHNEASLAPKTLAYRNITVAEEGGYMYADLPRFGRVMFTTLRELEARKEETPIFAVDRLELQYNENELTPLNQRAAAILAWLKMTGKNKWKVLR